MAERAGRPLRIGILGAARIARLFVPAVRPSSKVEVAAVASRDRVRAQALADDLRVPRVHASYEALLADPEIDAIYNPLANTLHAQWSIRALDAGKHVLCEKPLAVSQGEAESMFEAAQRNGRYLVEAYPYRAQPQTIRLRELLATGDIGKLQTVHAAFGFTMADPANIRLNRDLAGGALMDAGSYPVSFVRTVAGEAPTRVHAMARWADTGVDRTLIGSFEFPSGLLAQISCSFATARHRRALLVGGAGSIATTYYNDTSTDFPPLLEVRRGAGWDAKLETIETAATHGFLAEAESFHDLVRHGWDRWSGVTPQESIDIAAMLEALAASARDGRPRELTGGG
jgi:D-xylose 1-dehydrogenase (NADP+, D-xylono-1,5-lactone-forming)